MFSIKLGVFSWRIQISNKKIGFYLIFESGLRPYPPGRYHDWYYRIAPFKMNNVHLQSFLIRCVILDIFCCCLKIKIKKIYQLYSEVVYLYFVLNFFKAANFSKVLNYTIAPLKVKT